MRTTLDIEDPVLKAVKDMAHRQGRTAGAVASELLRQALSQPPVTGVRVPPAIYGFRAFAADPAGDPVTDDQVNRLRDDLGI
jgi:hypothetical protein